MSVGVATRLMRRARDLGRAGSLIISLDKALRLLPEFEWGQLPQ